MNQEFFSSMALGALAGALLVAAFCLLPSANFPARLRDWTRRLLGVEDFETMVRDELAQSRSETNAKASELFRNLADIRQRTVTNADSIRTNRARHNSMRSEAHLLRNQYDGLKQGMGPMWKTAEGIVRPLGMLSTAHLRNISKMPLRDAAVLNYIREELRRRATDQEFRTREQDAASPAVSKLPSGYTREMRDRVRRVLPLWARDLMNDLADASTRRMVTASEQMRINRVLPKWAIKLIEEMEDAQ